MTLFDANRDPGRQAATANGVLPGLELGHASRAIGKPTCEDFFDLACPSAADVARRGVVLALADGLSGGGSGGRRAAETCVRTVLSDYYGAPDDWGTAAALERIIGSVNGWLLSHNLRASEPQSMLSTLSVLVLHADRCFIAHVGDTRIYRLRGSSLERLTTDHVWVRKDMRHVLRRAVGLDEHLVVDGASDLLEPGDLFLMLSDGVWEVVGDKGIRDAVAQERHPGPIARALVERAMVMQRGYYGRNDATAAVLRVSRVPFGTAASGG